MLRTVAAAADCGLHLNGAAFAMRDLRHRSDSRVLVYGMYNINCPPPKTELVSCSVDLRLKSGNLTVSCLTAYQTAGGNVGNDPSGNGFVTTIHLVPLVLSARGLQSGRQCYPRRCATGLLLRR